MMNKKVRKFAVFLFLTACAGCTNSLQEPLSTDPTILSVETPKQVDFKAPTFTELQNKYMDIALNHELSQSSDSKLRAANLSVAEMTTDEKMAMIDLLTEQKNETTTLRTAQENSEEDAFFNAQYDTLVQELNRHPLVIEAMQKSDNKDKKSMMLFFGDSVVSKFDILKKQEEAEKELNTQSRTARIKLLARWGKEIHYRFVDGVPTENRNYTRRAMNECETAANYKFKFKEIPNSGWNQFVWGIGCYWHIRIDYKAIDGIGGNSTLACLPWASINYTPAGTYPRTYLHELGHNLGLIHEHQRSDRDNYITIHWENIATYQSQFSKYSSWYTQNYGEFDYNSISFNKPNKPTITKLDGSTFSSFSELSNQDKINIKQIYD